MPPKTSTRRVAGRSRGSEIRLFPVHGKGDRFFLPPLPEWKEEIDDMRDVLLGREPPPVDVGVATLMEVAEAYYARCVDIAMSIYRQEQEGIIKRGSDLYKFRTGELKMMIELCSRSANLGSRRITAEQLRQEKVRTGRESYR